MASLDLGWTVTTHDNTTLLSQRPMTATNMPNTLSEAEKERDMKEKERERRASNDKAALVRGLHSDALFNWQPANVSFIRCYWHLPYFLHLWQARYFVIKSFTEEDVWKSLKYSIWSSTEMGNRRLGQAFNEATSVLPASPVVLFFSVNASGHFCGVAQMMTGVDWGNSSSVWAQKKWRGTFGVRWVFVKDVPNAMLRHLKVV
jgi:hypothetical protein